MHGTCPNHIFFISVYTNLILFIRLGPGPMHEICQNRDEIEPKWEIRLTSGIGENASIKKTQKGYMVFCNMIDELNRSD